MAQPDSSAARELDGLPQRGELAAAIDHWRQSGERSQLARAAALLNKRGVQLFGASRVEEALGCFTLALRANADDAAALNNAAGCLKELGRLADSTALYRRAVALQPGFASAHGNILMNLQYTPGVTPAQLAKEQREWDERHAWPLRSPSPPVAADPEKVLRVGLVSSDLGDHPVGVFLVRYLEQSDRARFQFVSYADGRRQGALAARMQAAVAAWHDVRSLSDAELADKIRADKIDILIDLGGHTADNRLGVFARKPTPVQVMWLGYPGDSGLSAMDYVIGDRLILPLEMQPHCAAKILHLPGGFVCFDPPADAPPVSPLPATAPGQVVFGCFHNPAKCNTEVISLWAEILTRLPQAKLLLKYKGFGEAMCQRDFIAQFAAHGIMAERLEFQGASPQAEMFAAIQSVDIALDPFPFAGGLMSCLTLWMGVPVVTLPGESFASRQGLDFLTTIGVTETIAISRRDYADKAVALANDLPRLAALRQRLRAAMVASPLCDGAGAAAGLQDALRKAWRDACLR